MTDVKKEGDGEERGERRCHFLFIPFSFFFENRMHLLTQFVAKEMMNSVAPSLSFQGRKGRKMLSRTPGARVWPALGLHLFRW